jgi:exodeoxyribonuclease V gamma subunit
MSGRLNLYQGLDPVALAHKLAEVLKESRGYPFRKDIIIIDGKGPSNWLTHALVRRSGLGVQMNADLLSTWRIIPWLCCALREEHTKDMTRDPLQGLTAKLYALLSSDSPELIKLWKNYLGNPEEDYGIVCWNLCVRLTRHYRELLRNDADWIGKAERNPTDRWSKLWYAASRDLRKDCAGQPIHEADLLNVLKDRNNCEKIASRLPGRICLFSMGDVPRSHLQILEKLKDVIDVNLFFLQPSRDFLGDLNNYESGDTYDENQRSHAYGLLRLSGKHYRLQQEKVIDTENIDYSNGDEGFIASVGRASSGTLLGHIQKGIDDFQTEQVSLKQADDSVSIHRCHGAWREAEIVRDQIIAAFADPSMEGLCQGDILILSPEPEVHAPFLEGVLSAREPSFEFTTAAMQGLRKSPVGNLVKSLIELPEGRVTSLDILGILGLEVVRDHSQWNDSNLETIEEWFSDAPFQWGINKDHREHIISSGLDTVDSSDDATEVGTLGEFLKRLSLGSAFGGKPRLINDSLPLQDVDGQQSLVLAAESLRVISAIRDWVEFSYKDEHELSEWIKAFRKVSHSLRPESRNLLKEFSELTGALSRMERRIKQLGDTPINFKLFSQLVEEYCDFEAGVGQFMSGRITLAPLRSTSIHPAKIIILMGMNDGAFPRRASKIGPEVVDDKTTLTHQRIIASEETSIHAFLLAILSAQQRLIITFDGYVGSEGKPGNAAIPVEVFRAALQKSCKKFNVKTHGLLSHQRPTNDGGVPDYLVRDATAISIAASITKPNLNVLVPSLPKNAADFTLAEWVRFWESPPRFAMRQLGVHVPWSGKTISTSESLERDSSSEVKAKEWISDYVDSLRTMNKEPEWKIAEKTGYFPAKDGESLFDSLVLQEMEGEKTLQKKIYKYLTGNPPPDSPPTLEKFIKATEIPVYKTDKFRIFSVDNKVAVACFGYFNEEIHSYFWLMCMPALSKYLSRDLNELYVVGIKPPVLDSVGGDANDSTQKSESEDKSEERVDENTDTEIECDALRLIIPPSEINTFYEKTAEFMNSVIDKSSPVLPRTFITAISKGIAKSTKEIKISDATLHSRKPPKGDITDPRARVFIPEDYDFEAMKAKISDIISIGIRRDTKGKFDKKTSNKSKNRKDEDS